MTNKLNKRRKLFARMKKKTCAINKNSEESSESHHTSDADMEKVELPPTSFIAKYTEDVPIPAVEAPQMRSTSSSSPGDEVDGFVWVSMPGESKEVADSPQKCFKSPENSGESFRSNPPFAQSSTLNNGRLGVPQPLTSESNCVHEFEKSETTSTLLSGYQAEDEHNCQMTERYNSRDSCDDATSEGSVDDSSIFDVKGPNLPRSYPTDEELSTTSSECDSTSTKSTTYATSSDSSSSTYFTTSESISSSSATSAISTTEDMNEDADDDSSTDSYYTSKSTSFA